MTMLGGLLAVAPASSRGAEPVFDCSAGRNMVYLGEVNDAYSRRSIEMVQLAQRGNDDALARLVSPAARFAVWRGDAGIAGGVGIDGARAFVRALNVVSFDYSTVLPGPISIDACGGHQVTATFSRGGSDGFVATFRYADGQLVEAVAQFVTLSHGSLSRD